MPQIHMPNIAAALKAEIARLARKEIRSELNDLRKASARSRSEIASLKRQLADLQRAARTMGKRVAGEAKDDDQASEPRLRFRAGGLASHRKRLELSAGELGKLLGVSGQTVYAWAAGKSRPRASQMPRISALRRLGKRQAQEILASL